jgi:hypothetical protein
MLAAGADCGETETKDLISVFFIKDQIHKE